MKILECMVAARSYVHTFRSAFAIVYIYTLPIDYLHELRNALRSTTKLLANFPTRNFPPSGKALYLKLVC